MADMGLARRWEPETAACLTGETGGATPAGHPVAMGPACAVRLQLPPGHRVQALRWRLLRSWRPCAG